MTPGKFRLDHLRGGRWYHWAALAAALFLMFGLDPLLDARARIVPVLAARNAALNPVMKDRAP